MLVVYAWFTYHLVTLPASCPRWSGKARPPDVFDALSNLKTVIPVYVDRIKDDRD